MTRKRNYKKLLYALLTLLLLVITIIGGQGIIPAFADTSGSVSVLTDLQKDSNFNVNNYPEKSNDYSIQVIQIAESVNGELFIYTYQPCQNTRYLIATQVNMSLTDKMGDIVENDTEFNDEDKPKLYSLTLYSCGGVFCKYKVNDFMISKDKVRYYNIISIYREWIDGIDKETGNDNTIGEVSFKVGQLWTAETIENSVKYTFKEKSVITVTDKRVGMLRYSRGLLFGVESKCDSHYIAFSTDMRIDDLEEATVRFTTQRYSYSYSSFKTSKVGNEEKHCISITDKETVSSGTFGLFPNVHLWNRIQTVADFKKDIELNDDIVETLKDKQWVLRFVETDYSDIYGVGGGSTIWTKVYDTAILELTFVTDGERYSLGVVDNIQTGSGKPDNPDTGLKQPEFDFWQWLADKLGVPVWVAKLIVYGIVALVVLGIVMPILSIFFPIVGIILKVILKTVISVILAPFKFIAWLVRKCRGE